MPKATKSCYQWIQSSYYCCNSQ